VTGAAAKSWVHRNTVFRTVPAVPRENQDRVVTTAAACCVRRV